MVYKYLLVRHCNFNYNFIKYLSNDLVVDINL